MTEAVAPAHRPGYHATTALAVGLIVFALLWFLNIPYREVYQPNHDDVAELADGLLLVPGARWEDWFAQGQSHWFDGYPEWPLGWTAFARPAFQFVIYLAHFLFGQEWSSYLAINYLGVAGVVAVAFTIARTALAMSVRAALLAAVLVLLSPAVLELPIWELALASELMASVLVGGACLAVLARQDFVCLGILQVALLTKETAVWAPFAAALSVLLRPDPGTTRHRRIIVAAAMLLPLALWLALRFAFYGGIGGTYATAQYTPFIAFVGLIGRKLAHMQNLFISPAAFADQGGWASVDRAIRIGTALLVLLLLSAWMLSGARSAMGQILHPIRERRWPTTGAPLLVTLWAVLGSAFYFTLAVAAPRYTTSLAMFVWPALVGETVRRGKAFLGVSLAVCSVVSLGRASLPVVEMNPPSQQSYGQDLRAIADMNAALRGIPPSIQQVYVVTARGLVRTTPDYLRAFLGIHASIVRVVDVYSSCKPGERVVFFDHFSVDGVVTLSAAVPECGLLFFFFVGLDSAALKDGRLRRSDTIEYELPEAYVIDQEPLEPSLRPGRRMIAHIRPHGPARFIIEKGDPSGGLAWFDTP